MSWITFVFVSIIVALIAAFIVMVTNRRKPNPAYEDLKRDKATLQFTCTFIVFWLLVLPREAIEMFFGNLTRFILPICFMLIYLIAQRFFKSRYESRKKAPSAPQSST